MGTGVTNGWARGLVVATGMQTEFGRIARLTGTVADKTTPLQRRLAGLARQLGVLSVIAAGLVALIGVLMEKEWPYHQ